MTLAPPTGHFQSQTREQSGYFHHSVSQTRERFRSSAVSIFSLGLLCVWILQARIKFLLSLIQTVAVLNCSLFQAAAWWNLRLLAPPSSFNLQPFCFPAQID